MNRATTQTSDREEETGQSRAEGGEEKTVPPVRKPPRAAQDTQAVEGEHAVNPPAEIERVQGNRVQG